MKNIAILCAVTRQQTWNPQAPKCPGDPCHPCGGAAEAPDETADDSIEAGGPQPGQQGGLSDNQEEGPSRDQRDIRNRTHSQKTPRLREDRSGQGSWAPHEDAEEPHAIALSSDGTEEPRGTMPPGMWEGGSQQGQVTEGK